MFAYFRNRKLCAVLNAPGTEQFEQFIDCFNAGFDRGIKDFRAAAPLPVWVELVSNTSMRLAQEKTCAEAGCWLAGVIRGRIAANEDAGKHSSEQLRNEQMLAAFNSAWTSGHIRECAEHTLTPLLRRRHGPASLLLELSDQVLPG